MAVDEHAVETGETPHEAYRALRGAVLRTEVYAHDGTAKAVHPYQVTDNRYRVHQVQPKDGNHHGVYFSSQMESVSYHYERNPTDPRVSHALTLQVDDFGNPLKSLAIGYGRRRPDPGLPTQTDQDKQTQTLITYTENEFTNAIDDPIQDPTTTAHPCRPDPYLRADRIYPERTTPHGSASKNGPPTTSPSSGRPKKSGTKKPPTPPRNRNA